jgi:hypothetical protein
MVVYEAIFFNSLTKFSSVIMQQKKSLILASHPKGFSVRMSSVNNCCATFYAFIGENCSPNQ